MLGTALVGSVDPEVVISYVKPDTTIDYVDPSVGIFLDYDSKNKEFLGANGETFTVASVARTVELPKARNFTVTVGSEISMRPHVAESSGSRVRPAAAVLASFNVRLISGLVSPATKFISS